ncbi:hypothetical protein EDD17DRAFT_1485701, partial [Pisolithus thermaeus]
LATAMRENELPEDRIDSHVKFWLVLKGHTWRHRHCEISKCALLTYQTCMQCKWHDMLAHPALLQHCTHQPHTPFTD